MSNDFVGVVKAIKARDVKTRRGMSKAYSVLIDDQARGDTWVGFGFEAPVFAEGDRIKFEAVKNDGGYLEFVKGSGSMAPAPKEEAPKAAPPAEAESRPAQTYQSKGSYGNDPARQMSIILQHSQEMAISATGLLLQHDALPVTKAATKAGEAARFEQILATIDKLTVKYYNDAVGDRLLKTVADTGVISTAPDAPVPDPKKGAKVKASKVSEDDLASDGDDDSDNA